eukprot:TRINITY_DN596_c0_g1_i1.p1 TRINITY_DN596_c0_g1~~TRINITY_DN596_c0_g1_i1.p1  ORF type:complete len:175 (-),score=18.58 TRINITY_DN596_c0_g1_i1:13-537(-)
MLALFLGHYAQRTLIFPFLLRGGKPSALSATILAFLFCTVNGFVQTRPLTHFTPYPESYLFDLRFIIGVVLFIFGMYVNIQSDSILRNLRKPNETGYKIPRGGMFELISGANFFGEIVEWLGFAVANWSLGGFAFSLMTTCNIGPRAVHHHQWYVQKFKGEYPKNRKALLPFVF